MEYGVIRVDGGAASNQMSDDARAHKTSPAPFFQAFPCHGDAPGPRCGHTLTAIGTDGSSSASNLILFGVLTATLVWYSLQI